MNIINITNILDNAVDKLRDAAFETNDERKAAAYIEAADDLEDARSDVAEAARLLLGPEVLWGCKTQTARAR